MKYIITLFYLLFLSNIALAETSSDYAMGKKGTMDFEIKCTNENGQSSIHGFKKINDKLFVYVFEDEENIYGFPYSTVKQLKRKINDIELDIYMTFAPLLPDYGVGDGYGFMFSVLLDVNNKWQEFNYFVKDTSSEMGLEWLAIGNLKDSQEQDRRLYDWSKNAFKKISKQLDFGEPFELVDLDTINTNGLISDGNGNFYWSQQKCKKL